MSNYGVYVNSSSHFSPQSYENALITIATSHRKEEVMADVLDDFFGLDCLISRQLNTDIIGKYHRFDSIQKAIKRARMKCLLAVSTLNSNLVIANEGCYGSHPKVPVPMGTEVIYLMDRLNHIEFFTIHQSLDTNFGHFNMDNKPSDVLEVAKDMGFPDHGVILQFKFPMGSKTVLDLKSENEMLSMLEEHKLCSKVEVISDMRAMNNPTRMRTIQKATIDFSHQFYKRYPI